MTLEIKAGKYYKTRGGAKAFITAISLKNPFSPESDNYPAEGFIEVSPWRMTWTINGRRFGPSDASSEDLIEEWREPVTREFYVFMFRTGDHVSFTYSTNKPESSRASEIIACRKIKLTEGEFTD